MLWLASLLGLFAVGAAAIGSGDDLLPEDDGQGAEPEFPNKVSDEDDPTQLQNQVDENQGDETQSDYVREIVDFVLGDSDRSFLTPG